MTDQPDREHHDSMLNRLEIMRDALKPFQPGRGRLANMTNTIDTLNTEVFITMARAWESIHDPRWQGPAYVRFVAQRYAELSLCYTLIQTAYDELCSMNIVPQEARAELTTKDMAVIATAEEKLRKAAAKQRRKVAA